MGKPILAVCDSDSLFTETMTGVFRSKKGLPFEVHGFSDSGMLMEFLAHDPVEILMISEKQFKKYRETDKAAFVVVLKENDDFETAAHPCIPKYRSASGLYRNVMELYLKESDHVAKTVSSGERPVIFGIYSPIRRCRQTSLALTMAEHLSKTDACLYLNFEWFSGFERLMGQRFNGNMTDLLYYFQCDHERFPYRFESLVHKIDDLDYIPPGSSYVDYSGVTKEEWIGFITAIFEVGHYRYIVLDLTEQVVGLFDLMKLCDHIVTIYLDDPISEAKMTQYELLLEKIGCGEVWDKTYKCKLPKLTRAEFDPGKMTGTELMEEARRILRELKNTGKEREIRREDLL